MYALSSKHVVSFSFSRPPNLPSPAKNPVGAHVFVTLTVNLLVSNLFFFRSVTTDTDHLLIDLGFLDVTLYAVDRWADDLADAR